MATFFALPHLHAAPHITLRFSPRCIPLLLPDIHRPANPLSSTVPALLQHRRSNLQIYTVVPKASTSKHATIRHRIKRRVQQAARDVIFDKTDGQGGRKLLGQKGTLAFFPSGLEIAVLDWAVLRGEVERCVDVFLGVRRREERGERVGAVKSGTARSGVRGGKPGKVVEPPKEKVVERRWKPPGAVAAARPGIVLRPAGVPEKGRAEVRGIGDLLRSRKEAPQGARLNQRAQGGPNRAPMGGIGGLMAQRAQGEGNRAQASRIGGLMVQGAQGARQGGGGVQTGVRGGGESRGGGDGMRGREQRGAPGVGAGQARDQRGGGGGIGRPAGIGGDGNRRPAGQDNRPRPSNDRGFGGNIRGGFGGGNRGGNR